MKVFSRFCRGWWGHSEREGPGPMRGREQTIMSRGGFDADLGRGNLLPIMITRPFLGEVFKSVERFSHWRAFPKEKNEGPHRGRRLALSVISLSLITRLCLAVDLKHYVVRAPSAFFARFETFFFFCVFRPCRRRWRPHGSRHLHKKNTCRGADLRRSPPMYGETVFGSVRFPAGGGMERMIQPGSPPPRREPRTPAPLAKTDFVPGRVMHTCSSKGRFAHGHMVRTVSRSPLPPGGGGLGRECSLAIPACKSRDHGKERETEPERPCPTTSTQAHGITSGGAPRPGTKYPAPQ